LRRRGDAQQNGGLVSVYFGRKLKLQSCRTTKAGIPALTGVHKTVIQHMTITNMTRICGIDFQKNRWSTSEHVEHSVSTQMLYSNIVLGALTLDERRPTATLVSCHGNTKVHAYDCCGLINTENILMHVCNQLKLFSQFNVKMLTENILHLLLQQMLKLASLCTDTSPEMSSPFVTRQSPHRQLSAVGYSTPDTCPH